MKGNIYRLEKVFYYWSDLYETSNAYLKMNTKNILFVKKIYFRHTFFILIFSKINAIIKKYRDFSIFRVES